MCAVEMEGLRLDTIAIGPSPGIVVRNWRRRRRRKEAEMRKGEAANFYMYISTLLVASSTHQNTSSSPK